MGSVFSRMERLVGPLESSRSASPSRGKGGSMEEREVDVATNTEVRVYGDPALLDWSIFSR